MFRFSLSENVSEGCRRQPWNVSLRCRNAGLAGLGPAGLGGGTEERKWTNQRADDGEGLPVDPEHGQHLLGAHGRVVAPLQPRRLRHHRVHFGDAPLEQ